jgi:hypothetical protein
MLPFILVPPEEFRRLHSKQIGQTLIEVLRTSPHRDIDIVPVV